ncbi:hypothetical protein GCM10020220_071710 [Nonomuraea rubra]
MTDDVLRTLVLAVVLLGVERVLVMPHTDCGMAKVTDADVHAMASERGIDTRSLEFHTVPDQNEARQARPDQDQDVPVSCRRACRWAGRSTTSTRAGSPRPTTDPSRPPNAPTLRTPLRGPSPYEKGRDVH